MPMEGRATTLTRGAPLRWLGYFIARLQRRHRSRLQEAH